jgi:hypothetical protein
MSGTQSADTHQNLIKPVGSNQYLRTHLLASPSDGKVTTQQMCTDP